MALIPSLRTLVILATGSLRAGRGQAAYLILTLAITTTVWLALAAVGAPYEGDAASTRITIGNGSQSGALPLSYAPRIEAIRGARDVFFYGIQVVHCAAVTMVQLNAFGGPGMDTPLVKHKVSAAVIQQWNADPLAAVVSEAAATKCGWRVGQGVEPPSGMDGHGKPLDLHIVGTFPGAFPQAYVHYDYVNRAAPGLQGKDKVVTYFADTDGPRHSEAVAARVEAAFAHDFPALKATTNTTVQNAWSRFGKVQQLLAFVLAAVLLCAASVLVSVLAHATAQRKSRFAVLQVLGFQRFTLFSAFALELLAIAALGTLLGIAFERLLAYELAPTTLGFLTGGVHVPAWGWWGLPVWLAVLTGAALAWPAASIARVRPADYRAI